MSGYIGEIDGRIKVGELRTLGYGRKPAREFTYFLHVVILHDMASAAGDGYSVEHLEELEIEVIEQSFGSAFRSVEFCPFVIYPLGVAEYLVNVLVEVKFGINIVSMSLVGKL